MREFQGDEVGQVLRLIVAVLLPPAELGEPPYRSNQVAARYGVKDQRGVSMHRDSLIQKGLIWSPRRGQVDFTVPLFAEFLRDNHPLSSFEQT